MAGLKKQVEIYSSENTETVFSEMSSIEKLKKLKSIVNSVNEKVSKALGQKIEAVSILGERKDLLERTRVSTGNPAIDRVLGGGIVCGVPIEIYGPPGIGKAQPNWCMVLTPKGFVPIEELELGDDILTPSGEIAYIKGIFPQGVKQTYKITLDDGSYTYCCKEHLWKVKYSPVGQESLAGGWELFPLQDLLRRKYIDYVIPPVSAMDFPLTERHTELAQQLISSIDNCKKFDIKEYQTLVTSDKKIRTKLLSSFYQGDYTFYSNSSEVAQFVANLGRSLGHSMVVKSTQGSYSVQMSISYTPKRISSIVAATEEKCSCISISCKEKIYITDNFIPTHNTTSALAIAKEFIKLDKVVMFINIEQQVLPIDQFEAAGITQKDMDNLIVVPAYGSGEKVFDIVKDFLIDKKTGQPHKLVDCIVLDSIAALAPQGEINSIEKDGFEASTVGSHARMVGKFLRQMCGTGAIHSKACMVLINQTREKVNTSGPAGGGSTPTGGNAPKFFAKLIIELKEDWEISKLLVDKSTGEKKGIGVIATVVKNNTGIPGRKAAYSYIYGEGLDFMTPVIEEAKDLGIIVRESSVMWGVPTPEGYEKIKGIDAMTQRVRKSPEVFQHIKTLVENSRGAGSSAEATDFTADMYNSLMENIEQITPEE